MEYWIAHFFESGHKFSYILNMSYFDYLEIVNCFKTKNEISTGKKQSNDLRPVQKNAIRELKNRKKVN